MMRKLFIGILLGILLTLPLTAGAQTTSIIGKKIQNEYTVKLNGEALPVKAIAVDGVSYTPNRSLTDALGLQVKFENKTVLIEGDLSMNDPAVTGLSVEGIEFDIQGLEIALKNFQGFLDRATTPEAKELNQKRIIETEAQIKLLEELKAELIAAQATPTP